jgi:DNA-binding transcriptional MerR regulator/quercetin dioxygenase-like cupin family protein
MSKTRKVPQRKLSKGRLYFAISDVSTLLSVSPSTLRMWENMGLITPDRTSGGRRRYSPEKVERLKYIQRLRTEKKLNVEAIREVLGTAAQLDREPAKVSATGVSISRHLRKLRRQRSMTLSQAANGTNLSVSFLSSLERGKTNASVATLQKLAVFYGTNVQSFFGTSKKPLKLVTPRIRKQLSNEPGINIELLSSGNNVMEPHLYRIAPGTSSGGSYHHEGEEFIYVISGSCEIWLDELEHYALREGDCLYFPSTQTHRWSNSGNETAVLLWTNTPPTF